jgi:hypothetical protein
MWCAVLRSAAASRIAIVPGYKLSGTTTAQKWKNSLQLSCMLLGWNELACGRAAMK